MAQIEILQHKGHRFMYLDDYLWMWDTPQEKELQFPNGSVVVDLGGGTGEDALYFMQTGHSVVLFDISEYALKVAKTCYIHVFT